MSNLQEQADYVNNALGIDVEAEWALVEMEILNSPEDEIEIVNDNEIEVEINSERVTGSIVA